MNRVVVGVALCLTHVSTTSACPMPVPSAEEIKLDLQILEGRDGGLPLSLQFRLTNVGARNFWVSKRMMFNGPFAPDTVREVWLDVKRGESEIRFQCKPNVLTSPSDSDYVLLAPGKSVSVVDQTFFGCYVMSRPGSYMLQGHYKDGNPRPPAPPPGAIYLSTEIKSEPIRLDVPPSR